MKEVKTELEQVKDTVRDLVKEYASTLSTIMQLTEGVGELAERVEALDKKLNQMYGVAIADQEPKLSDWTPNEPRTIELPDDTFDAINKFYPSLERGLEKADEPYLVKVGSTMFIRFKKEAK